MFVELVSQSDKFSTSLEFAVLGIVDMSAIPEDKKGIPIGGNDNPIPLVEFTNLSKRRKSGKTRRRKNRK